jgi:radical SAM superfamily enzyme YgiQ (UPF0313 family)
MKPMKVLLVNPNIIDPPIFPVGLEYNAEFLRDYGCEVDILDLNISDDFSRLHRNDLILIGIRNLDSGAGNVNSEMRKLKRIVLKIKESYCGDIGIGGAAVNILPQELLDFLQVDYALVQKGFGSIRKLIDDFQRGVQKPRIIRDYSSFINGHFQRNMHDKTFYLKNDGRIGVATKFGCPFKCQYCNYPAVDGSSLFLRDPDEVIDEVVSLVKGGASRIFFCDSNFNIPVAHANVVLEKLLRKNIQVDIDGFHNPQSTAFTREYLALFRRLGIKNIHLGVDSLAEKVLEETKKGFTLKDIEGAVALCREMGVTYSCSLLFGHPSETVDSVKETFYQAVRLKFKYVDVSCMVRIFPHTELQEIALKNRVIQATDSLVFPFFYPVPAEVRSTIEQLRKTHEMFHDPSYRQYVEL